MGISMNFLPIKDFSLDKKIPRAIAREPIGVFRGLWRGSLWNPRSSEKIAYRGLCRT